MEATGPRGWGNAFTERQDTNGQVCLPRHPDTVNANHA